MSGLRKIQLFSLTVMTLAGLSVSTPAAGLGIGGGGCVESWCSDECMADLLSFCEEEAGCESHEASCALSECVGVNGLEYDYRIECGLARESHF